MEQTIGLFHLSAKQDKTFYLILLKSFPKILLFPISFLFLSLQYFPPHASSILPVSLIVIQHLW